MIQTKGDLEYYIKCDKERNAKPRWFEYLLRSETFHLHKYLVLLRKTEFYKNNQSKGFLYKFLYGFYLLRLFHTGKKIGLGVSPNATGAGLTIIHTSNIMISYDAKIGKNFTIRTGSVVGNSIADQRAPIIGDNVVLSTGVKVTGKVNIGRGAWIDSNAVVMKYIPPYAIAMGIPAKVVAFRFSPEEIVEMEKKEYAPEERIPLEELQKNYQKYYKDRLDEIKHIIK